MVIGGHISAEHCLYHANLPTKLHTIDVAPCFVLQAMDQSLVGILHNGFRHGAPSYTVCRCGSNKKAEI
jgi:hypothetical protein